MGKTNNISKTFQEALNNIEELQKEIKEKDKKFSDLEKRFDILVKYTNAIEEDYKKIFLKYHKQEDTGCLNKNHNDICIINLTGEDFE
jgi:predicted nuclease with TOPRIM domain